MLRLGDHLDAALRKWAGAAALEGHDWEEQEEAALEDVRRLETEISKIRAKSLAGLKVKAKLALSANIDAKDVWQLDRPIRDQDWTISVLTRLIAEIEHLATGGPEPC